MEQNVSYLTMLKQRKEAKTFVPVETIQPKKTDGFRKRMSSIKLNALLEVTKAINNNASVERLFQIYQDILVNELKIGRLALYIFDNRWLCALRYGVQIGDDELDVENDLAKVNEITDIGVVSSSLKNSFDLVIPVFHKSQPLSYLLIGDLDEDKLEISPTIKHLPFIQTLTNVIVVAIENKKLSKEYFRQIAANKELELASKMQSLLFPSVLPNDRFLDVAAYYQPHLQVGGDYYDFIRLNDNEVAFCIADVSGKGVSAALLMANFQANLRALFRYQSSLPEIIFELNNIVSQNAKGEKFITLFVAKYNMITRVLNYINAGHNPPILFTESTSLLLTTGCIGLGMLPEIPKMKEGITYIVSGSILTCFTDGLIEQNNEDEEEYGFENLKRVVMQNFDRSSKELNNALIDDLNIFRGGKGFIDDIALLSSRFR